MDNSFQIEDIEDLRLREGIDDIELRAQVRNLQAGDFVKLTFQTIKKSFASETLLVRITSIKGCIFRGKLAESPANPSASSLRAGATLSFSAAHIHSIAKRQLENPTKRGQDL